MRLDVYLPMLAAAVLGLAARPLSRAMPPGVGAQTLVGAGLACAAGSVWALGLLAWTAVGELPVFGRVGGWSTEALHADNPVPPTVSYAAGVLLLAVTAGFGLTAIDRIAALRTTQTLARRASNQTSGELVVLPDDDPEAFALPTLRRGAGHIVVSTGMLRALDTAERRVLFAHERAHLTSRHHWWMLAAQLCAAANPLLTRLPAAVDHLLERAADEAAAAAVGDRRLAARALARASLATLDARRGRTTPTDSPRRITLSYATTSAAVRVAALLADPPPRRRILLFAIAAAVLVVAGGAIAAGLDIEHLFESAMRPDPAR